MRIVEVIPIAKGAAIETLTYFTASDVEIGSVIRVPLRKRIVPALVLKSDDMRDMKSQIKKSAFALKKIERLQSSHFLRHEFVEAAERTAEYYAGFTGSAIHALVPSIFFEESEKMKIPQNAKKAHARKQEHFVIQSNNEDRLAHYKSIIREEFAKGASVFFCLPTVQDIVKVTEALQKGIEAYTFVLHGSLPKKKIMEITNAILAEKHPVLVIATGGFLSLPMQRLGTIIVERESARAYKQLVRPFIDMRNFAEIFADAIDAKIIFGDLLLRAETIYRHKIGELVEIAPLKFRTLVTPKENLIDMRPKKEELENGQEKKKEVFRIFSPDLEEIMKETIEKKSRLFLFVARRGLSPSTICADCGTVVKCNACGAHVVLHKSLTGNFFLCHLCGARRDANEKCAYCGGWRLTTLGIGSVLVEDKIKKMFPNALVLRIDADTTPTYAKAQKAAEKFYSASGVILIGTEMALSYLSTPVANCAVVSMDTFFSIPDFRIYERILGILLKLRALAEKKFLIQTRDAGQKIFEYALAGNLIDFFKNEMEDRKTLGYPPFSTLIKISVSGRKPEATAMMEQVQKIIPPLHIDIFPAFIPGKKGAYSINGIIKIPERRWLDVDIVEKLKDLPPNISVNVDPESLM